MPLCVVLFLFPIKLHAAGTIIDTGGVKDQQDFSMQFIDPGNITYSCTDDLRVTHGPGVMSGIGDTYCFHFTNKSANSRIVITHDRIGTYNGRTIGCTTTYSDFTFMSGSDPYIGIYETFAYGVDYGDLYNFKASYSFFYTDTKQPVEVDGYISFSSMNWREYIIYLTDNSANAYITNDSYIVSEIRNWKGRNYTIYAGTNNDFTDNVNGSTYLKATLMIPVHGSTLEFVYGHYHDNNSYVWAYPSTMPIGICHPGNPVKSVNKPEFEIGDMIEYKISQKVNWMQVDTSQKYSSFRIEDTLPKEVDYVSAYLTNENGQKVNAGSVNYDPNTRKLVYTFSSDYLKNQMRYVGETYHLVIEGTVNSSMNGGTAFYNQSTSYINGRVASSNSVKATPYYKITTEVENGTIDDAIHRISKGQTKTIKYRANNGYMIKSITVDGVSCAVNSYLTSYTFSNITGNHHIKVVYEKIPLKSMNVIKTWDDGNDADGLRPSSVTVSLLKNEKDFRTVNLNVSNSWEGTVSNLPIYDEFRNVMDYEFVEKQVPSGYTPNYTSSGNTTTIRNFHYYQRTEVSVTKTWDDGDDADGLRPSTVSLNLLANDQVSKSNIKLEAKNNWKFTIKDLPRNKKGIPIEYRFEEAKVPTGYEVSEYDFTSNADHSKWNTTLENFHDYHKVELIISKEWNDSEDSSGIRPRNVSYQIFGNGIEITEDQLKEDFTLSTANTWTQTLYGVRNTGEEVTTLNSNDIYSVLLPLNKKGVPIDYSIQETVVPDGYTVSYSVVKDQEKDNVTPIHLKMINSHDVETISKTVQKVWDDSNNRDGQRPESIQVGLYHTGSIGSTPQLYQEIILNDENGWEATVSNLPVSIHGTEQSYTFQELSEIEGYTSSVKVEGDVTTITNTYKPKVTSATVTKVWNDENNQDGTRPKEIQVILSSSNPAVGTIKTVTLNESNNWTYTESSLPRYYQDNGTTKEIVYTWTEQPVIGYKQEKLINGNNCTLINTYVPDMQTLYIEKTWNDQNNQDQIRPQTITLDLFANGDYYSSIEIRENEDWQCQVQVPVKMNGQDVVYEVKEHAVDGYVSEVKMSGDQIQITNTHIPETIQATVQIHWEDADNQDGLRPDTLTLLLQKDGVTLSEQLLVTENGDWYGVYKDLPKYEDGEEIVYTFVLKDEVTGYTASYDYTYEDNHTDIYLFHGRETTSVTVQKIWNDQNNQDGKRPDSLSIDLRRNHKTIETITLNEENHWTVTKENLPVYIDGEKQEYSFVESKIPIGYRSEITTEGTKTIITNTYEPETKDLTVTKIWDDQNDQDGKRPAFVTIALLANNTQIKTVTLSESNNWKGEIKDLPVYQNGEEITYLFRELELPEGYSATYEDGANTVITNHYDPNVKNLMIRKVWEDTLNQDGLRPESIAVQINANDTLYEVVTLFEENHWETQLTNLPVYEDGEEIEYTAEEVGVPEGYTSSISQSSSSIVITNTHIPETVTATVQKVWDDFNDADQIRPEEVNVVLMRNGTPLLDENGKPYVYPLSEKNNGYVSVSGLPRYENGKPIQYTFVLEDAIDEYTSTRETIGQNTTITSVHRWSTIDLTVEKVWKDTNNADGLRPSEVEIVLLQDGTPIENIFLDESNGWKTTIKNLRETYQGHTYEYQFVEVSHPEGYLSDTEANGTVTTITNTHEIELVDPSVELIWQDENNSDGLRPDKVIVILTDGTNPIFDENGNPIELVLNEENNWSGRIPDLQANQNGTPIPYEFVLKDEIPSYASTSEVEGIHTTLTAVHDPERISVNVTKVWENDNSEVRPESIQVILLINGKEMDQVITLSEDNNWSGSFTDLLKYENGTEIPYTVKEIEVPEGYTPSIIQDGYDITLTNTYEDVKEEPPVEEEPSTPSDPTPSTESTVSNTQQTSAQDQAVDDTPQTGDTAPIILFISMFVLSGIGILLRETKEK